MLEQLDGIFADLNVVVMGKSLIALARAAEAERVRRADWRGRERNAAKSLEELAE
jgi:hypothetical protein